MKLDEKLKSKNSDTLWQEYCGFLELDIDGYMRIQNRLMIEQIRLWSESGIGRLFLKDKKPLTVEDFRQTVPLTNYEDYADVLLARREDMLPAPPAIWIKTTWEGGTHPVKVAPYTQGMLDTYRINMGACLILFGSTSKGKFELGKHILSGFAPLPYPTGLMGLMLQQETSMEFLPPLSKSKDMSFSQQNKEGFKMAMRCGVDYFFSMGSVAYCISNMLMQAGGSGGKQSLRVIIRYLRAKLRARREDRDMLPKDLFRLKSLVCAGTDNHCYKDELEKMWGIRPMELFAGTEPTLIGVETWNRKDMYFFPDACFYEFLSLHEAEIAHEDPEFIPNTFLMNEVVPGEKYELVISVLKGGAFARYRTGDVYLCTGIGCPEDDTRIPRFRYIDRVPWVIDIGGFTRITESSIQSVIDLSRLPISDWCAAKEYDEKGHPLMHVYAEMLRGQSMNFSLSQELLKEHLGIYFKYLDNDYKDLKRLLNMDPLKVTILRSGTFAEYESKKGKTVAKMNPPAHELRELVAVQGDFFASDGGPMMGGTV